MRRLSFVLAVGTLAASSAAVAQTPVPPPSDDIVRLDTERRQAERAHLTRLAVWAGASLAGGTALALTGARGSSRRAFGFQTAAWGAVNAAIAGYGLTRDPSPAGTLAETRRREDGYHDILLFNEGLNVAYVATGATMAIAAARGVRGADAWRGHGWAVVVQGAMLLALDGVAIVDSRKRLRALDRVTVTSSSVGMAPGAGIAVRF